MIALQTDLYQDLKRAAVQINTSNVPRLQTTLMQNMVGTARLQFQRIFFQIQAGDLKMHWALEYFACGVTII